MKRLLTACAATAALAVPLAMLPTAAHAEPTTYLSPAQIERGPNPKVPHVDGKTVVDGSRRIRVNATTVDLVAKAGSAAYIVRTTGKDGSNPRLLRVTTSSSRVIARGDLTRTAQVAADGKRVAMATSGGDVRVISSTTGSLQRNRHFNGSLSLLEFAGGRVLVSAWQGAGGRTVWWNPSTNTTSLIVAKPAYIADAAADRLAYYTGDPFEDGCSVLTKLSAPSTTVWRSCGERVAAISPDGSRLAAIHILSDGIGPRSVKLRSGAGIAIATYKTEWFGSIQWETNRALLLETHGRNWTATVRATANTVNRASKLTRTVQP